VREKEPPFPLPLVFFSSSSSSSPFFFSLLRDNRVLGRTRSKRWPLITKGNPNIRLLSQGFLLFGLSPLTSVLTFALAQDLFPFPDSSMVSAFRDENLRIIIAIDRSDNHPVLLEWKKAKEFELPLACPLHLSPLKSRYRISALGKRSSPAKLSVPPFMHSKSTWLVTMARLYLAEGVGGAPGLFRRLTNAAEHLDFLAPKDICGLVACPWISHGIRLWPL
jgi:hypothetical protein